MTAAVGWLFFLLWPAVCSWVWEGITVQWFRRRWDFCLGWAAAAGGMLITALANAVWLDASAAGLSLAAALFCRWWRRRRRGVLRLAGAKTRALRDRLARRARDAARPRPVYRPQPQGVS